MNLNHGSSVDQVRSNRDVLVMRNILSVIKMVQMGQSMRPVQATDNRSMLEVIEDMGYDDFEGQGNKARCQYLAYTATRHHTVQRVQIAGVLRAGLDPHNGSRGWFQRWLEVEETQRSKQIRLHFNMYTMMRGYLDTEADLCNYAVFCCKGLPRRYLAEYFVLVEEDWEELECFDRGIGLAARLVGLGTPIAGPASAPSAVSRLLPAPYDHTSAQSGGVSGLSLSAGGVSGGVSGFPVLSSARSNLPSPLPPSALPGSMAPPPPRQFARPSEQPAHPASPRRRPSEDNYMEGLLSGEAFSNEQLLASMRSAAFTGTVASRHMPGTTLDGHRPAPMIDSEMTGILAGEIVTNEDLLRSIRASAHLR
ncbi:hypothetical protein MMC18_001808 [Xylographa bjoerkii]|nr:hypothetical protein [Xylographa bjoerkii]